MKKLSITIRKFPYRGCIQTYRSCVYPSKTSRANIAAHYDLGNAMFETFLDPTMMYSSAVFPRPEASLEEASRHKLDRICQQLELKPSDHLLEIGTGWGGMAIHAAKHYGCRVTTTTISKEQFEYAQARVAAEGLQDRVILLLEDYRDLTGEYDKLVSIEMIEAVGHTYYDSYFRQCARLLKPQGLMLLQAITMADQRYELARKRVDFIQKYIFPGGALPSVTAILDKLTGKTDLRLINLDDITPHYAETLKRWRQNFLAARARLHELGYDEAFVRLWDFYFCYCEDGFRERAIGTVHMLLAKPGYRQPDPVASGAKFD